MKQECQEYCSGPTTGKLAALVSIEDLKLLQQLEDQQDIDDAWKMKNEPDENVKLPDLKKELNL